jgi:hypothetical protein
VEEPTKIYRSNSGRSSAAFETETRKMYGLVTEGLAQANIFSIVTMGRNGLSG